MDANDLVERALGVEAQLARPARLDALRPAFDDARDQGIMVAADARRRPVAGNAPQRRDLLGDRAADAGHREIDTRSESVAGETRRVDEEADRGARACMGMHDGVGDRERGFEPCQRFADDAGEKTRSRLVRLARPHHDARQANADAVAKAAPGVVGEEEFPDGLLRAVGG